MLCDVLVLDPSLPHRDVTYRLCGLTERRRGRVYWRGEFEAEQGRWVCRKLRWREEDTTRRRGWVGGEHLQCQESFG